MLLTDVPTGADSQVEDAILDSSLDLIRLIAPTTRPERASAIADQGQGFLYYIARTGVTGASESLAEGLEEEVIVYPPEPWGLHPDQFVLGRDVLNRWHISLRPTAGDLGEFDISPQDDDPPGPFFSPPNY